MSILARSFLNTILSIDNTKNAPTPIPTKMMMSLLPTWSASTVKSGSAIVIKKPRAKHINTIGLSDLDFLVSPAPTCSPIGVIATSAPRVKNPIPSIKNNADTQNTTISSVVRLISGVKLSITTISVIGSIDISDSLIFPNKERKNKIRTSLAVQWLG